MLRRQAVVEDERPGAGGAGQCRGEMAVRAGRADDVAAAVEVEQDDVVPRRGRHEPLRGRDGRGHVPDGHLRRDRERALGALVLRPLLRERQRPRRRELRQVGEDGFDAMLGHVGPPIARPE